MVQGLVESRLLLHGRERRALVSKSHNSTGGLLAQQSLFLGLSTVLLSLN